MIFFSSKPSKQVVTNFYFSSKNTLNSEQKGPMGPIQKGAVQLDPITCSPMGHDWTVHDVDPPPETCRWAILSIGSGRRPVKLTPVVFFHDGPSLLTLTLRNQYGS